MMKLINEFEVLANEECWLDEGLIYLKDEPIGKFSLDDSCEEVAVVFEIDSKKLKMELEDVEQSTIFEDTKIEQGSKGYTDSDLLDARTLSIEESNWYVKWREKLIAYSLIILFLLEYFGVLRFNLDAFLKSWYLLYAIFFCITCDKKHIAGFSSLVCS